LGISVTLEYLRRQVSNAKNIPAETNNVLRLNFCVWTLQHTKAINIEQWMACESMPSEAELVGAEYCCGCLDIGETDDFTAWGRLWVLEDGRLAVKMRYWLPEIALERYTNRPYDQWRRAGILTVTEGDVTDYAVVRQTILEDARHDGLRSIFYDPRTARETSQLLAAEGLEMVQIPQGFALNEAIKRFLALVSSGKLCHGNEAILTWMASNLVLLTGTKGDKRIAKERAPEKIDGIAALVMGIDGGLVRRERPPEKTYQMLFVGGGQ
jgi:phage terminase large subunit-like protein